MIQREKNGTACQVSEGILVLYTSCMSLISLFTGIDGFSKENVTHAITANLALKIGRLSK